eukprot:Gb_03094 [translate_table: standard]
MPAGIGSCDITAGEYKIELGMNSTREDHSKGGAQLAYAEEKTGCSNVGGDCLAPTSVVKSIPSLLPVKESLDAEPFLKRHKQELRDSSSQAKPITPFKFPLLECQLLGIRAKKKQARLVRFDGFDGVPPINGSMASPLIQMGFR